MFKVVSLGLAVLAGFGAVLNHNTPWFIPDIMICILCLGLFWLVRVPRDTSGKRIRRT